MNINDTSTQLMYTTAPIYAQLSGNRISSGTGFIFSAIQNDGKSIPLLITNYHVLKGATNGFIELHISESGMPSKKVVRVQFDNKVIEMGKLGELDLVALPLAGAINDIQTRGTLLFFKSIDVGLFPKDNIIDDLAALEDVTFIGYPNSLYDTVNKLPVIREGITATPIWNDFAGKEEFLIDAGVFPGSSGSPVFIYNRGTYPIKDGIAVGSRLLFVGVLGQTLRRKENEDYAYLDLGVVINSKAVYRELNNYIVKLTGKPIQRQL